jgi:uncharacterized membrane protein YccC
MLARVASFEGAKQAVKTALAGVIALYVTTLFHLPEGYWAAISALIVMQSNVGATLNASRTRLAGTAVGAAIGGLFLAVFGMNLLAFAVAITIAFFVCDMLNLAESQRLATVTVAIIMLVAHSASAWVIALHRFTEVVLGILVALIVSLTLWPNHARRNVRQNLADILLELAVLYRAVMDNYLGHTFRTTPDTPSIEALRSGVSAAVHRNNDLLQFALQEAFGPMKERESLALLAQQAERISHALDTLEFAVRDSSTDTYFRTFESGLQQLEDSVAMTLETFSKTVDEGKLYPVPPNLPATFASINEQAVQARKAGATRNYPLDEILRFHFLLLSSGNLIEELELLRSLVAQRFAP